METCLCFGNRAEETNTFQQHCCVKMKCTAILEQYIFAEMLFQLYYGARIDYSSDFRIRNVTLCEQLLVSSLEVNKWKFSDLSTDKQTAILLTAMPCTVSVTDVSRISEELLNDIRKKMTRLAYICEVERDHNELCDAMISLYKKWKSNPMEEISNNTLAYMKNGKEKVLSDEDVEIVHAKEKEKKENPKSNIKRTALFLMK